MVAPSNFIFCAKLGCLLDSGHNSVSPRYVIERWIYIGRSGRICTGYFFFFRGIWGVVGEKEWELGRQHSMAALSVCVDKKDGPHTHAFTNLSLYVSGTKRIYRQGLTLEAF